MPANVAEQPALLEYGLWIVLNLQRRADDRTQVHVGGTPLDPCQQIVDPRLEQGNARRLPHLDQFPARLVQPARQPESDRPDPVVGTRQNCRRLDSEKPIDFA